MKNFVFLFLLVASAAAYSQSKQSTSPDSTVILQGDDYAFSITVPAGWKLIPGEGTWAAHKAILFPLGVPESQARMWGNPDAWITIGIATKKVEGGQTLKNLLAHFDKQDSAWIPAPTILNGPNLTTSDKKTANFKQVKGDRFVARAFIEDESIVTVIEMHRFSEKDFTMALPSLKKVVESYKTVAAEKKSAK